MLLQHFNILRLDTAVYAKNGIIEMKQYLKNKNEFKPIVMFLKHANMLIMCLRHAYFMNSC